MSATYEANNSTQRWPPRAADRSVMDTVWSWIDFRSLWRGGREIMCAKGTEPRRAAARTHGSASYVEKQKKKTASSI